MGLAYGELVNEHEELLRRFEAVVGGQELDDLRRIDGAQRPSDRPRVRRPSRPQPVTYRVRVELDDSSPSIWRMLVLKSDIRLDVLHSVLQNAFGWSDSHLYRFSLGEDLFGAETESFLCPSEAAAGEVGIPSSKVTLEQALRNPGDELHYVYDFGDNWALTVRLEEVLPLDLNLPLARCVAGERAAPPENCGGIRTADELAQVLPDPASFDLARVDRGLLDPALLLGDDVSVSFVRLLRRLKTTEVGDRLMGLVQGMLNNRVAIDMEEFDAAMRPVLWFLQRAKGEGIALTSAGYLRPDDVAAAAEVVPGAKGWIGKKNRETQTTPVLVFREMLQSLGLLRKRNGRLMLTQAGARGLVDSGFLWGHIASRLIPKKPRFEQEASQVILLCALTPAGTLDQNLVAEAVAALGWTTDGRPLFFREIATSTQVLDLLMNLAGEEFDKRHRYRMNSVARRLAWEALNWR